MRYKMGEIATIIDGDRGKNYPKQEDFLNAGYCLFLDTGNVTKAGFLFDNTQYISEEKCNALRKGKMKRGDIAYTTRGTVGNAAYYGESIPYEHMRINSGMVIIRVHDKLVTAPFLYQILKHDKYRAYFKQYCTGSAQPQLPIKTFSQIEIDIPDREVQDRISLILMSYDSLIENHQKQIKLLEEAAQRLYKEWFVDLRFPGYEDVEFVGGLPKNWKKDSAEKIFNITIGKTPPRLEKQWFVSGNEGIPWLSISDMGGSGTFVFTTNEGLTEEAIDKYNMKVVPSGTIFVSFKLTVGRIAIATTNMCTNEAIAHFYIDDDIFRPYTYCYLKSFEYDTLGNTSSISKAVNSKIIKSMPFIMPNQDILSSFSKIVEPILNEIKNKQAIIIKLAEARDRLLPKLMNGEIEVK